MAKIHIKFEKLTPFGGIFSIMEQFDSTLSNDYVETFSDMRRSLSSGDVAKHAVFH